MVLTRPCSLATRSTRSAAVGAPWRTRPAPHPAASGTPPHACPGRKRLEKRGKAIEKRCFAIENGPARPLGSSAGCVQRRSWPVAPDPRLDPGGASSRAPTCGKACSKHANASKIIQKPRKIMEKVMKTHQQMAVRRPISPAFRLFRLQLELLGALLELLRLLLEAQDEAVQVGVRQRTSGPIDFTYGFP